MVFSPKKKMKERKNCSFYSLSNMGAEYHRGHKLCDASGDNIRCCLCTTPVLEPSPISSTSACILFHLNRCILTEPHLLPVPSLFSFFSHECCPVKAAAVPYLISAHRLKYPIGKFREVNTLDNGRPGSVDKFFSYLPFPTQGQF